MHQWDIIVISPYHAKLLSQALYAWGDPKYRKCETVAHLLEVYSGMHGAGARALYENKIVNLANYLVTTIAWLSFLC